MTIHHAAWTTIVPARRWARLAVAALLTCMAGLPAAPPAQAGSLDAASTIFAVQDPGPSPSPPETVLVPGGPPAPTEPGGVPPAVDAPPGGGDPHWWDLGGRVRQAITDWLTDVVTDGIRATTGLLAGLLHTPDPRGDPRVRQLWLSSLVIADAFYLLLVVAGGVILAGHETLQTRYTLAQVAPRLVVGMVAAHASLSLAGEIVTLGNAFSVAFLADRVDPAQVSLRLRDSLESWLAGANSAFLALLGLVALVLLVAVGFTVIVRHALVLLLTAAAPLALACHALPQTEAAARLWWRSLVGLLVAQAGQALALVTLERVVLTSSGPRLVPFGGITSDLLIVIGLLYVMLRIPGWAATAAFGRGGFSAGRLVGYAIVHSAVRQVTRTVLRVPHRVGYHGRHRTSGPTPPDQPSGGGYGRGSLGPRGGPHAPSPPGPHSGSVRTESGATTGGTRPAPGSRSAPVPHASAPPPRFEPPSSRPPDPVPRTGRAHSGRPAGYPPAIHRSGSGRRRPDGGAR